jgi:hypothetical protein
MAFYSTFFRYSVLRRSGFLGLGQPRPFFTRLDRDGLDRHFRPYIPRLILGYQRVTPAVFPNPSCAGWATSCGTGMSGTTLPVSTRWWYTEPDARTLADGSLPPTEPDAIHSAGGSLYPMPENPLVCTTLYLLP